MKLSKTEELAETSKRFILDNLHEDFCVSFIGHRLHPYHRTASTSADYLSVQSDLESTTHSRNSTWHAADALFIFKLFVLDHYHRVKTGRVVLPGFTPKW